MNDFEFCISTDVKFGRAQVEKLSQVLGQYGNKVLLTYGGGSMKRIGLYDRVVKQLEGCQVTELSGIAANPKVESVREGVRLCKENGIEVIVAVGGGSVIDCSKAISSSVGMDKDIVDIVAEQVFITNALPIIAIPTLAATGSETDAGAVVVNTEKHEKITIFSPFIMPKVSLIEPENTFSVPARQTAAGCSDIMSHLMEQYFVPSAPYLSDQLVEGVMRTIVKYARVAMDEPENYEARAQILWGSDIGDNATLCNGNQLCVFGVHAMEHLLSGGFNTTHGEGLAVLELAWMKYVLSPETAPRFAHFGEAVFGVTPTGDTMTDAQAAIDALNKFYRSLDLPSTLTELGIPADADLEKMAAAAEAEGTAYAWIPLTKEDILAIYKSAM
ncbi:MAG: iron-containing alcohol dehydrogenase [Bacteroidales bacterium]|nr:iron-containing alcohol dehydrogenase [Bacteroidales bacterium]